MGVLAVILPMFAALEKVPAAGALCFYPNPEGIIRYRVWPGPEG